MASEEGARVEVAFEVIVTLGVDAPIPDENDMERVLHQMVPEISDAYDVAVERLPDDR